MAIRAAISGVRNAVLEAGHGATSYFRRRAHRDRLATVEQRDRSILNALEADGACSTTLEALGAAGSMELVSASDRLFAEMSGFDPGQRDKNYMIAADPSVITRYPDVVRWGLNERLLAIAENYIGMPVAYRGVLARLDMPDGRVRETRLWHLDQEDSRILKIVVYISDVDDDGGPFEYIPASFEQPIHLVHGGKKRIDDEEAFDDAVPPDRRRAVVGPRGTVGFVDTCRILHRGRLPLTGTRKSLFFAYNSLWPMRPSYCGPMFLVDDFKSQGAALTARQAAALDFDYYRRFA